MGEQPPSRQDWSPVCIAVWLILASVDPDRSCRRCTTRRRACRAPCGSTGMESSHRGANHLYWSPDQGAACRDPPHQACPSCFFCRSILLTRRRAPLLGPCCTLHRKGMGIGMVRVSPPYDRGTPVRLPQSIWARQSGAARLLPGLKLTDMEDGYARIYEELLSTL